VLPGQRSLFLSRLCLCPRRSRSLRLQLIAERPKVLKLSKGSLERQSRPSRGTPTPPGYGYLTCHLPHRATHTRLSGSASRQASPSARNEEETRLHAQIPRCSGLDSHNEHTTILKVPLQTELRFHSRGYELPPHRRACGTANSGWLVGDRCTNSAATTSVSDGKTAAAMAPGRMLPLEGPRSRPLTGDENQPLKPKSQRPGARVALTVSSGETTSSGCPPTPHQRAAAAPKRTSRSSLPFSPRERERDHPRTRVPPSWRTTCCAADGAGRTWTRPARARHDRRPGGGRTVAPCPGSSSSPSPTWLEDASSVDLEDDFLPRMPEEEAGRWPT
jgi:hypothetical protein